ncbi:MAG: hypothetical protein NTY38_22035 [Acidobacteria bacterium]|nr:hypothetical protein [Acidobacteriota bacterium]
MMMDELVGKVSETTGLNPMMAKIAVETVLGFLKDRLPSPLASGLESFLGKQETAGEVNAEGFAGKATDLLGGLFGKNG